MVLTRASDITVGLFDRAELANKSMASAFVSIHCNAASSPEAEGFEVLHHPKSERGKRLAELINLNTSILFVKNRGLKKRDDLVVLNKTTCPAALVEMGFLSNPREAKMLARPEFRLSLAKAIASGIRSYMGVR